MLANSSSMKNVCTGNSPPHSSAKSYNLCIICEKNIVNKKSYAACVSDDITYNAVFSFPISSKSIVFVDVNSAIAFESNLPNLDCSDDKIDPYVLSDDTSIDL